jgi:hypothetical protein
MASPPTVRFMLRRAFLRLFPAILALAFLCGTPNAGISAPDTGAKSWTTVVTTAPVARGSLTQDIADVAVNQTADEDDTPDDRIVRVVTTIVWPDSAFQTRILQASDRAGDRHKPCAAPPRAPPIA